jgi:hypothetical protein
MSGNAIGVIPVYRRRLTALLQGISPMFPFSGAPRSGLLFGLTAFAADGAGNNCFNLSAIGPQHQSFDYLETISFVDSELSV